MTAREEEGHRQDTTETSQGRKVFRETSLVCMRTTSLSTAAVYKELEFTRCARNPGLNQNAEDSETDLFS